MICPNCQTDLRYSDRPNRRCRRCGRPFALEPKTSPLRAHDMRLRNADDVLSARGTLWYTEGQLHWRLMRGRLERVLQLTKWLRREPREKLRVPAAATPEAVRRLIIDRYAEVYGAPPPALATRERAKLALATSDPPDAPLAVVACSDLDVLGCLAMNAIPDRMGVALVGLGTGGEPVPTTAASARAFEDASLPLLVLRDASLYGQWLAASMRYQHGERVRDVGLSIAAARQNTALPRPQGPAVVVDPGLAPDEHDRAWLASGYWVALAAISPARVIKAVGRGVANAIATGPKDEARLEARSVGFL